jgi:hypothetical protein
MHGQRQLAGMFMDFVDREHWPQYYEAGAFFSFCFSSAAKQKTLQWLFQSPYGWISVQKKK